MVGGGIRHLPGMTGKGYANHYANHQSPPLAPGAQDSFQKPGRYFLICSHPPRTSSPHSGSFLGRAVLHLTNVAYGSVP